MTVFASAGADKSAVEGQSVSLSGTGSKIPDGMNVGIEWTQESGTTVSLSNADTLTASFIAPEVDASYNFV